MTNPGKEPAATCNYCGRENSDRLAACTGCGTRTGGLWVTIGGRIVCAIWAYYAVSEQAPNELHDSARLLDEAARLESTDFSKAIGAYEEIMRRYPDSRASQQAADAIATLKKRV